MSFFASNCLNCRVKRKIGRTVSCRCCSRHICSCHWVCASLLCVATTMDPSFSGVEEVSGTEPATHHHHFDQDGKSTFLPIHTLNDYIEAVRRRRAMFHPPEQARSTRKGYTIVPVGAALHGAQIHALSLSMDSSILLSAGSDGYVRWYDLFASMNGKNMLTQNLRNSFVEGITKGGVLMTWWGHAHLNRGANLSTDAADAPLSAVHSLACQRDALWGVSGGESGTINLWSLRHRPGSTRHVFHKHTGAVSVLALDPSEEHLVSGGWDRGVHVRIAVNKDITNFSNGISTRAKLCVHMADMLARCRVLHFGPCTCRAWIRCLM